MTRTPLMLLAVLCLLGLGLPAHAAGTCALSTVISPPFPVVVKKTQTVGAVLWNGTISTTFTCINLPTLNHSTYQVLGITASNTAAAVMGNATLSVALNGTPSWTFTSGCSQSGAAGDTPGTAYGIWLNATAGASCTITQTAPVKIMAAAATLSGIIPAPTAGNYLANGNAGFVPTYYSTGGYASLATGSQVAGMGSPSVSSTTTTGYNPATPVACTVSPTTTAVSLPKVSTHALSTPGAIAGTTGFSLNLSGCVSATSAYVATLTWSYTDGGVSGVGTLKNTGTASGVVTQILDVSFNPISNGGTSTINVAAAGGAASQQHYARYYAKTAAGAGTVAGTATFNLNYN
ncbi:hypothetical protein [Roseateles sp.]|uniref:fimbrial protein n=1 Tax=Roseateles sp. TaxID=1971397 RepID=UPI002DFB31CF|nr:hypothetical protein [Roseateles sp.]